MHYIIDTTGHVVAAFKDYQAAITTKRLVYQRPDWSILSVESKRQYTPRQSTPKQVAAVRFCESLDFPEFIGNINSFYDCSSYLSEYLEQAKSMYQELSGEYETYVQELD